MFDRRCERQSGGPGEEGTRLSRIRLGGRLTAGEYKRRDKIGKEKLSLPRADFATVVQQRSPECTVEKQRDAWIRDKTRSLASRYSRLLFSFSFFTTSIASATFSFPRAVTSIHLYPRVQPTITSNATGPRYSGILRAAQPAA